MKHKSGLRRLLLGLLGLAALRLHARRDWPHPFEERGAMNFMIYPLGCFAFWVYGFAIGWGNWFNGPLAPGWYASLGPGTVVLNSGWGLGAAQFLAKPLDVEVVRRTVLPLVS